jgi:hypothetical protein
LPGAELKATGPGPHSPDGRFLARIEAKVIRLFPTRPQVPDPDEGRRWVEPDLRWHAAELQEAQQAKQWFAAAFHLQRLLLQRPWDADLHAQRAAALLRLGQAEDAARHALQAILLSRWMVPAPPKPLDQTALNTSIEAAARRAQWPQVKAALVQSLNLNLHGDAAAQHYPWYRLAPVLAYLGEADAYRQHRTAMLQRFAGTEDPAVAERTVKGCLLLAAEGDELKRLRLLANLAVARGQAGHRIRPYAELAQGMAAYRQGQYAAAEAILRSSTRRPHWNERIPAGLYLAMSLHKQGKAPVAAATLKQTLAALDKEVPQPGNPRFGADWHDWLICQTLRREAEALLAAKGKGDTN